MAIIDKRFLSTITNVANAAMKRQYPIMGEKHFSEYDCLVVIHTFLAALNYEPEENKIEDGE